MSRLRRLVLSDRFFFVSCRLARHRELLSEAEFEQLAGVMRQRREEHRFLLTAWVLMPDHWHAIIFPRFPLTISRVMEAIKVGSTLRINGARKRKGLLWQPRFFDRALSKVAQTCSLSLRLLVLKNEPQSIALRTKLCATALGHSDTMRHREDDCQESTADRKLGGPRYPLGHVVPASPARVGWVYLYVPAPQSPRPVHQ